MSATGFRRWCYGGPPSLSACAFSATAIMPPTCHLKEYAHNVWLGFEWLYGAHPAHRFRATRLKGD